MTDHDKLTPEREPHDIEAARKWLAGTSFSDDAKRGIVKHLLWENALADLDAERSAHRKTRTEADAAIYEVHNGQRAQIEQGQRIKQLHTELAETRAEVERLVSANEHWHLRVSQMTTEIALLGEVIDKERTEADEGSLNVQPTPEAPDPSSSAKRT